MCKGKKNQKDSPSKSQLTAKYVQEEEQEDFTFQVRVDNLALAIVPLLKFESMG